MPPLQQVRTALQYQTYKQQCAAGWRILWMSFGREKRLNENEK